LLLKSKIAINLSLIFGVSFKKFDMGKGSRAHLAGQMERLENLPICIIVTTFNRRDTTHRFLESLMLQLQQFSTSATVVLVDDASSDGTPEMVLKEFPKVILLCGTGQLYWAGGVRLAVNHLSEKLNDFRGILLINDDVILADGSISSMIKIAETHGALIGGTVATYSGEIESSGSSLGLICKPKPKLKIANGTVQDCDLLPGHIMYIPMSIYRKLGGFDEKLPYRFIDLEFSLRTKRSGIPVLLAPEVVAFTEEVHNYYEETSSKRGSLPELVRNILLDPKGPHWRESAYYLRKVSPILWWLWLPLYYRAFFVAVFRSYFEKLPFVSKPSTPVTLEK
jgi:GT2 family glycosyltransferase